MSYLLQIRIKSILILFSAFALSALLFGCSQLDGEEEVDLSAPAELVDYEKLYDVQRVWSRDLGEGAEDRYSVLTPAIDGELLYSVDRYGKLSVVDLRTGELAWTKTIEDVNVTGATGASNGFVLFGTSEGVIVALDQETGESRWTAKLTSEVLVAPATNGKVVVAVTVDGKVFGLNAEDGSELWLVDNSLPLLTLRGNANPIIVPNLRMANGATIDLVFVGHDNGKVSAYTADDGIMVWEARVGVPEGATDLERIVDVDAEPIYFNGSVYAVSYQGGVVSLQPDTGRANWYQEASSVNSPAGYGGTLALAEQSGVIRAFNSLEGTELWMSEEYLNRRPNTPIVTSDYVAFADFKGYVHILSRRGGQTVGRYKSSNQGVSELKRHRGQRVGPYPDGDDGIRAATMYYNGQVLVFDNSGTLSSYSVTALD